ncbi:MAG: alpha/beta hydrolase [Phycisphaerales bacterium]|nr:alpha/beta hydrolase [Phycisphaerales bacterium]
MAAGDRLFYMPTREIYGHPEAYGLAYEPIEFASEDGTRLHGWFFPAGSAARGTVVHCHGNAGNITGHFERIRWLPPRGWNVLCFDYRGYGRSNGVPSRAGTIADARSAVRYVQTRSDVDAGRVVLWGQSLGGAIGIVVAAEIEAVRGIVVEGAFSSYRGEAGFICRQSVLFSPFAGLLTRALISNGHEPIGSVADIAPRPVFFICGTRDHIVDHRQTVALHEAAGEPKELWVIDGGGHTDATLRPDGPERLLSFFEQCVAD